ncbi:MarR family winged helix-turn-helix transcriptional regulator [Saccharopolyspora sp. 5N708]|uniref:MarR family winged helix-turn-helix transcriptional regulator n=1 Tax=Saccharopolyspora sp. 5N708 TaxID=3457424 RepID=UPI003FCFDF47
MQPTDDAPPTALRQSPSWLIGQASAYAHRLVSDGLATVGARRYHFSVLSALAERGPVSQIALGRSCHLDRSDIAAVVGELGEHGHIERQPDPTDLRRNIVTITPEGTRHLAQLRRLVAEAQDDLLAPLDEDDRQRLLSLMTQVVEHHATLRGAGWA